MASISNKLISDTEKRAVGKLNTTLNPDVLDEFKRNCKMTGVPMNTLIEAFMRQYNAGGFYLKFGRNKKIEVDLKDGEIKE